MKAVLMKSAGNSDVLSYQKAFEEPVINDLVGLKVKIHAAGVNPIDTKVRAFNMFYPDNRNIILGCDFAGEVVEVASSVRKFRIGDKVWGCDGGLGDEQGCYADYKVIKEHHLAFMPHHITYHQAAASPLACITAWGALFERGRLQCNETVLIHAGAGGVGHIAIQLAKIKGARVITTVSSPEKADFVKRLGADEVILYPEGAVLEKLNDLTAGRGADLVFDTVGGNVLAESIAMTAHYGRLVTLLSAEGMDLSEARMRNLSLAFELMLTPMLRDLPAERIKQIEILNQCRLLMETGKLTTHVSEIFALEEAKKAHDKIEAGHTMGKMVLQV